MDGIRGVSLFVFLVVAVGCRHAADVPFPDWLATARTARASSSTGAFDQLASAAKDAEQLGGKDLKRVYFTPQKRTDLIERLSGPMARVSQACRGRIEMPPRVAKPFEALPYQAGWRAIGRAMVWRIERSASLNKTGEAVDWNLAATRFGIALTAGSASDAELGYATIEEARQALSSVFGKLNAAELRRLGTGIEAALGNRPRPDDLIRNERESMLAAVQEIQDSYRERRLGGLLTQLGKDIDPAIDYLDKLRTEDPKERAQYFEDFATEAELWTAHYDQALHRNARQRVNSPGPALKQDRPWRRFSRHFFRSIEPLLAVRDECLARTRLLGLNALLLAECKTNGAAPGSLTGLSKELTIDPYSGKELMYRPDGAYFLLYSIGADFKDDGGETNQDGTAPDLRLEEP
jgi:hypothetical protein